MAVAWPVLTVNEPRKSTAKLLQIQKNHTSQPRSCTQRSCFVCVRVRRVGAIKLITGLMGRPVIC